MVSSRDWFWFRLMFGARQWISEFIASASASNFCACSLDAKGLGDEEAGDPFQIGRQHRKRESEVDGGVATAAPLLDILDVPVGRGLKPVIRETASSDGPLFLVGCSDL